MPFQIVRNDITRMNVDAVVNAANEQLRHGGGVCGAIFKAAGARQLQAACDEIGHCSTGGAVATPGFGLRARHIIHAVGPIWRGGAYGEEQALRGCYRSALVLAHELGDTSIAFPLISSGIYGYPKDAAIDVALDEIRAFLATHDMDVYLTIFDAEALRASKGRFAHIAEYIDDLYVARSHYLRREQGERSVPMAEEDADAAPYYNVPPASARMASPAVRTTSSPAPAAPAAASSAAPGASRPKWHGDHKGFLKRLLNRLDESFSVTLLRMIDERGLKDSDVYKRANMSRQHFSKIRNAPDYRPKKQTVLALAIALELSLDDTRLLLERAGFALSHADKRDVIVEYFINRNSYDIYEINLALYAFDQPLLG